MKNKYELVLILKSSATEEKQKEISKLIEKSIQPEGKIINTNNLGKKVLSYPIKKEKEGIYLLLTLEMLADSTRTLIEKFKLSEIILRHLLIRLVPMTSHRQSEKDSS